LASRATAPHLAQKNAGVSFGRGICFFSVIVYSFPYLKEEIIKTDIRILYTTDKQRVSECVTLMEFLVKYKTTINVSWFIDHFVIR
jgi:hypothetical protein